MRKRLFELKNSSIEGIDKSSENKTKTKEKEENKKLSSKILND